MTTVVSPYSAAVAAVIGPIEATATRAPHARRSSSLNSSAKLRAVDELVNVTASIVPSASASRRRSTPFSTRRVWYAGTSVTTAPSRRSSTTSTSRVSFARGSSTRAPAPSSGLSRSTSPSARYSPGTTSTRTPCSASASAVAGPIAATRFFATTDHGIPRTPRRRSTMRTPFTLVKITQANVSREASAASRGAPEAGGSIAIAGACTTRAPASSRSWTNRCACAAARVTRIVRPASGLVPVTRALTRATLHPEPGDGGGAAFQERFGEPGADARGLPGRPAVDAAEHRPPVLARDERRHREPVTAEDGVGRDRRIAGGAEPREVGALRQRAGPRRRVVEALHQRAAAAVRLADLDGEDPLPHRRHEHVGGEGPRVRRGEAEPVEARRREDDALPPPALQLPETRVHVAPDRLDDEIGPQRQRDRAAARARRADHRPRREVLEARAGPRHQHIARVLTLRERREREPRRHLGGNVLQAVDLAVHGPLDLLHEEPLAADGGQPRLEQPVALGADRNDLDFHTGAPEALRHGARLGQRQGAPAGAEPDHCSGVRGPGRLRGWPDQDAPRLRPALAITLSFICAPGRTARGRARATSGARPRARTRGAS